MVLEATTPALVSCLASVLPGLVDGPARHPAYAALGIRRLRLADLADALAGLEREPGLVAPPLHGAGRAGAGPGG